MPFSQQLLSDYITVKKVLETKKISFEDWLNKKSPELQWDPKHLKYMRDNGLNQLLAGEPKKIMFFLPIQHGKSTQNTVHLAACYMEKYQDKNIVLAANTQDFANIFSRQIRKLIDPSLVKMSRSRDATKEWELAAGGRFTCGGIGIGTGLPIDLCLIDDPIKERKDAQSKSYRDDVWNWWVWSIAPRIKDRTSVIFTMTRWHHDDLAARILEVEADEWTVISMPGVYDDPAFVDPLGRKIGEALWPQEYSVEKLQGFKKKYGDMYQSLIQQRPTATEGSIFKREYLKYYSERPKNSRLIVQSVDMANKKGALNDYTVCTTWELTKEADYLIDVWRNKCDYPEAKKALVALHDKYKPHRVLVEDKANGQAYIQELRRNTKIRVFPINPVGGKEDRAYTAAEAFRSGNVLLPERASWLSDYVEELTTFPNGHHDDQVDSTTQLLDFSRTHGGREVNFYAF